MVMIKMQTIGSRAALALLGALALAGCAAGPDFQRPAAPAVNSYTSGAAPERTAGATGHGGASQAFVAAKDIQADWWRLFHSAKLNTLIDQALTGSPTLKAAQATLKEAQENLTAVKGGLYPQVDVNASATRQKFSGAQFGGVAGGGSIFNLYGASVNVSYNLDVFGATRRSVEAQQAQVDFQHYQLDAAYLTLVGNVVGTAVTTASVKAQIDATQSIIESEQRQLKLVVDQEQAGAVPYSDVLQARAQLAATRTRIAPLRQQLSQAQHQLAILAGQLPGNWQPVDFSINDLALPKELPLTVPSQLVRQRPDILSAEAALHAASAAVGVATANLYPQFNLSGSYGSQATEAGDLFEAPNVIWNLGVSLLAPIFHGGALHAKKRAAVAAYEASLADYQQTVLTAFAQVADVLRALENDADSLKAQEVSRSAAEKSLDLVRSQYKAGAVSFVSVLTAEQQYETAQLGYVQALAQRYLDTASLFNALGGGWWNAGNLMSDQTAAPAAPQATEKSSDNGDRK